MGQTGNPASTALSVVAIILAIAALTVPFAVPGPQGPLGPRGPAGPQGPPGTGLAPKTQKLTIAIMDHVVVQEVNGTEVETGHFHAFAPETFTVKKGDTVEVTVINRDEHAHSLVLPAFNADTGRIPGDEEEPAVTGRTVTVTFVADKSGPYEYACGIPFNPDLMDCAPDHSHMVGYLMVLDV